MNMLDGDVHQMTYEEVLKFCAEYLPQLKKANPNSIRVAALCKLYEDVKKLHLAVNTIACYHDHNANKYLKQNDSYAAFDEPGSVQIARELLQRL